MKLEIFAGKHDRRFCPVILEIEDIGIHSDIVLKARNETLPAQIISENGKNYIVTVISFLPKGESAVYEIVPEKSENDLYIKKEDGRLNIFMEGALYTSYVYDKSFAKPHIGPFFNKYGDALTRYDFTAKEHPHHRSVWFSHGSVNGIDTWNEPEDCGYIINKSAEVLYSGSAACAFYAENTWTDHGKKPLCDDKLTVRFFRTGSNLVTMETELTLIAKYDDVTLGSTKEAGPIAVRMADNLIADKTGIIYNASGALGEEELWMKRSEWCDYSGKTDENHMGGIAVLDNPGNDGFPSYWHTRNYGLMAPNNFYLGGDRIIKKGESMIFKYRIIFHEGDCFAAGISDRFCDYAYPPTAKIIK